MIHLAKRTWLALALLALISATAIPAAAAPTLQFFEMRDPPEQDPAGAWFTFPTGSSCGLFHLYFIQGTDQNGPIYNPDGTFSLPLADGAYDFTLLGTGGITGPQANLILTFAEGSFTIDTLHPNGSATFGQTTVTVTNFTFENYGTPGQTDRIGICDFNPDGDTDAVGHLTLEVHSESPPPSSGPIHRWSGNGNASDALGNADGSLGSTTAFAAGVAGQAFSFDAQESSIIGLPVDINPDVLPQMTVGMWVKLRSRANDQGWVFGHDNSGYDRSLNLHDARYGYGVAGGTGTDPHYSPLQLTMNEWHFVAAVYDRDHTTATYYADGVWQTVYANPGSGELTATLGGLRNYPYHTVDGLVDEVVLYNRALTPQELDQLRSEITIPTNHSPDVSAAAPSIASIWPPNHKMVPITINGVTDPDGDVVTITINSITNNETGTADASGIGTSTGQVAATRKGKGTGRTYTITFTATDGKGGSTLGSVTVVVPHNGPNGELADDDDQGDDHGDDHGKVEKKDDDKNKKEDSKAEKKDDDKGKKDDDKTKKTVAKAPAKGRAKPTAVENATWGEVKNSQQ